jgi:hypothetical protein
MSKRTDCYDVCLDVCLDVYMDDVNRLLTMRMGLILDVFVYGCFLILRMISMKQGSTESGR